MKAWKSLKISVNPLPNNPYFNPLPDEKILDWSKLKEIADDILKCIESEK